MEKEEELERLRELSKAKESRGGKGGIKQEQQNDTYTKTGKDKNIQEKKQEEIKVGKANSVEKGIQSDFSDK